MPAGGPADQYPMPSPSFMARTLLPAAGSPGKVAGHRVAPAALHEVGPGLGGADLGRLPAPRPEPAPRRRIGGTRRVTGQHDPAAAGPPGGAAGRAGRGGRPPSAPARPRPPAG